MLYFQPVTFHAAISDQKYMEAALNSAAGHSGGFNFPTINEEHVKLFKLFFTDVTITKSKEKFSKAEEL